MSKYDTLWHFLAAQKAGPLTLTFEEITRIAGAALDHSFLTYKKELPAYGWKVGKISMKEQTVLFERLEGTSACGETKKLL